MSARSQKRRGLIIQVALIAHHEPTATLHNDISSINIENRVCASGVETSFIGKGKEWRVYTSASFLLKLPVQNTLFCFMICVAEYGNHGCLLWVLQPRAFCVAPYCLERNLLLENFSCVCKLWSEFKLQFL